MATLDPKGSVAHWHDHTLGSLLSARAVKAAPTRPEEVGRGRDGALAGAVPLDLVVAVCGRRGSEAESDVPAVPSGLADCGRACQAQVEVDDLCARRTRVPEASSAAHVGEALCARVKVRTLVYPHACERAGGTFGTADVGLATFRTSSAPWPTVPLRKISGAADQRGVRRGRV